MSEHIINYSLLVSDRNTMHRDLISKFMEEDPGTGKGDNCSRYIYIVEHYQSYEIYLKRPATLNRGVDFTVNVNGFWFKRNRRYSNPYHNDIIDILNFCKNTYPNDYSKVVDSIVKIYKCKPVDFSTPLNVYFLDYEGNNHPIEIILLAIKWLFMEQDCTYWNYTGRQMLYEKLRSENLI